MNLLKTIVFPLFIAFTTTTGYSQDNDWRTYKKNPSKLATTDKQQLDTSKKELVFTKNEGQVTIRQDAKIDSLTNQIGRKPFINGYTIQIEVSQQKSIIRNARYVFIKHNPDVTIDEVYEQPNTYLYAGRFYDKDSAYEFAHQIRRDFPDAIVIQKKLNLPPLKSE